MSSPCLRSQLFNERSHLGSGMYEKNTPQLARARDVIAVTGVKVPAHIRTKVRTAAFVVL